MAINHSKPMRFTPKGVTDAFDASEKFVGACQQLTNLVFDQSNPELVVSRPGVTTLANLLNGGFANPAFISVQVAIGTRIYGMVATSRNPGKDEPFCYDQSTGSFVTISGVTNLNSPTSPSASGDWTPPTIANVGTLIYVTHPGFDGTGTRFFGVIDITNPMFPAWSSKNTAGTALPTVPISVANFNNRAYLVCAGAAGQPNNQLFYTDDLSNPPTITNPSQFLVIGDASPVTAQAGLPVTTSSSGVIGALILFKPTQIWQITGDTTTGDLAETYVSLNIGTASPRSVAQSPYGIYFAGAGGPYFLDQLGVVRPVSHGGEGALEPDLNAAFQNAITPSRWAAGYIATTYRICGQTTLNGIGQFIDYWFDEHKRRWNGPHTFQYDCCSVVNNFFVLSSANNPGLLLQSQPYQAVTSVYQDLGSAYQATILTATFPKTNDELMKQVAESTIELTSTFTNTLYTITAQNSQAQTTGQVTILVSNGGSEWNAFDWNDGTVWSIDPRWDMGAAWDEVGLYWDMASQLRPRTYPVLWAAPLVFDKMQLQITASATANIGIGTFYARYQQTGYQAWIAGTQTQSLGAYNGTQ